jgi:predicted porin
MGLGASYDLGAAKLFGTYQTSKVDTGGGASSDKEMSFSAVAPVGPGALLAQVAKTTIDSDTTVGGKTGLTVAYLHSMSKMTTLYGAVTQIKQDAGVGTGANVSNTTTILAVGVRKKF